MHPGQRLEQECLFSWCRSPFSVRTFPARKEEETLHNLKEKPPAGMAVLDSLKTVTKSQRLLKSSEETKAIKCV